MQRLQRWAEALHLLKTACVERLSTWLPKLAYPIRTGEHSQTAFAFGLVLDYARAAGDDDLADLVEKTSRRLYQSDTAGDLELRALGTGFPFAAFWPRPISCGGSCTPAEFADWLGIPAGHSGNGRPTGCPWPRSPTGPTASWPTSTA